MPAWLHVAPFAVCCATFLTMWWVLGDDLKNGTITFSRKDLRYAPYVMAVCVLGAGVSAWPVLLWVAGMFIP